MASGSPQAQAVRSARRAPVGLAPLALRSRAVVLLEPGARQALPSSRAPEAAATWLRASGFLQLGADQRQPVLEIRGAGLVFRIQRFVGQRPQPLELFCVCAQARLKLRWNDFVRRNAPTFGERLQERLTRHLKERRR